MYCSTSLDKEQTAECNQILTIIVTLLNTVDGIIECRDVNGYPGSRDPNLLPEPG